MWLGLTMARLEPPRPVVHAASEPQRPGRLQTGLGCPSALSSWVCTGASANSHVPCGVEAEFFQEAEPSVTGTS